MVAEIEVAVCAWCGCVLRWYVPPEERMAHPWSGEPMDCETTHGICEACAAELRKEHGRSERDDHRHTGSEQPTV